MKNGVRDSIAGGTYMATKMSNQRGTEQVLAESQWLERVAYSLVRDDDEAKDVVQETYVVAVNSVPPKDRPLRGWLGRVATNVVRMNHRSGTRRAAREQAVAQVNDSPTKRPAQRLYQKQVAEFLSEAIQRLAEPLRSAVLLRYVNDMTIAQVAAKQGVPVGTADSRIREALRRLRGDLDSQAEGDARPWLMALCPVVGISETQAATAAAIGKSNIMKPILLSLSLFTIVAAGYLFVSHSNSGADSRTGTSLEETSVAHSQSINQKSTDSTSSYGNPQASKIGYPPAGTEVPESQRSDLKIYSVISITSTDTDSSWLNRETKPHLYKCMFAMTKMSTRSNHVQELELSLKLSHQGQSIAATLSGPSDFLKRKVSVLLIQESGEYHVVAPSEIYAELKKHPPHSYVLSMIEEEGIVIALGADFSHEGRARPWPMNSLVAGIDIATVTESCLEDELHGTKLGATESDVERQLAIRLTPKEPTQTKQVLTDAQTEAIAEEGPSRGTQGAPIVIVAFLDYEDPYSAKALAILDDIEEHYPARVQIVIKHFPVVHPESLAAEAANAAENQGKFWEMHNLLFANPKQHTRTDLLVYAQQLKLDLPRFQAALEGREFHGAIEADQNTGKSLGVRGTPSFLINGELVTGAHSARIFYQLIDTQLGKE